jgi:hypothetical protein
MNQTTDPLESLVVDQREVDRGVLARGLAPFIRVDREKRTYAFLPAVKERLDNRRIVLASLLARKALGLLISDYTEACPPRVLESETGIPGGTLRPVLKDLSGKRLLTKQGEGYLVANYSLDSAISAIGKPATDD